MYGMSEHPQWNGRLDDSYRAVVFRINDTAENSILLPDADLASVFVPRRRICRVAPHPVSEVLSPFARPGYILR